MHDPFAAKSTSRGTSGGVVGDSVDDDDDFYNTASAASTAGNATSTSLSRLEYNDLKEAFELFDTNENGRISLNELRLVVKEIVQEESSSAPTTNPTLRRILKVLQQHQPSAKPANTSTTNSSNSTSHGSILQQNESDYGNGLVSSKKYKDKGKGKGKDVNDDYDDDDDVYLSLDDFITMMTTPDPMDQREELRKVFDLFDTNQKGYITLHDLQQIAIDLGEHDISIDELQEMIHHAASYTSTDSDSTNWNNENYLSSNNNHNNIPTILPTKDKKNVADGENVVTYEQFKQIMNQKLF